MNKFYGFSLLTICIIASLFLSSCGKNKSDSDVTSNKSATKDYDLFIYNSYSDISEDFSKMCEEYSARTGVIVKCVTPGEDEDADAQLEDYINSGSAPDIFTIKNMKELKKWQNSGNVLDFSNATETNFKDIANGITPSIRLSSNTVDNFGMPYTIEGCGYIVDPKMLSSLFGGDKYRAVLNGLKTCTYDEFEGFINAISSYINYGEIYEFQINGELYSLLPKRSGLSENLNGVFSFSAGTPVYTGVYTMDAALSSAFNSPSEVNTASDEKIASLTDTFSSFAKGLELITSSVASKNGGLTRGIELVNNVTNSPSQSLKSFVNGQSLLLIGKNTIYDSMFLLDSSLANRVSFIPIKMPFDSINITAPNMTEKVYSSSISISVPMYFSINAKSEEKQKKLAQDFLVWFKTSEIAQKYIIQSFKFIPYDIKESSAIDNQLSRSMIEYVSSGHILPSVSKGFPDTLTDTISKSIIDQYYTKSSWSIDDYDSIAEQIIRNWQRLK